MPIEDKYSTGLVWQDFQHKQLLDLFAKIKKAKAAKEGFEIISYSVAFLAMYVNHHFKLEEEYMKIYSYPEADVHKKEHKGYIKEIKLFREKFKDCDEKALEKLLMTLNQWIINHIMKDDKKLGDFVQDCEKKGLKAADA